MVSLRIKWWWYRKTHKKFNKTKEERHRNYVEALDWYKQYGISWVGLCNAFVAIGKGYLNRHNYPELWIQKPSGNRVWWWDILDSKSRITALENAIKLSK